MNSNLLAVFSAISNNDINLARKLVTNLDVDDGMLLNIIATRAYNISRTTLESTVLPDFHGNI